MKTISLGVGSQQKLKKGIDLVHSFVVSTLGPWGSPVVLDRGFSVPIVADDGVSIVKALHGTDIEGVDDIERQGIDLIAEVADKTNQEAGDGTTTSIILAHAIVEEGLKYSENPLEIKRSLEQASYKVVEQLKKLSKPIKNDKEILQVATLSANSKELGQQIADIYKEVGKDGTISVEQSLLPYIEVKVTEGYQVEKGYAHYFMQTEEGKSVYENVKVIVIGNRLDNIPGLIPLYELMVKSGITKFVLFCVDLDQDVLVNILANKQQAKFNCLVVKANSQNQEILQDIALITGAKFISTEKGMKIQDTKLADLGSAKTIIADKEKTIIRGGRGKWDSKIKELKVQLLTEKDSNQYDLIENHIARLESKVGVISVGAKTDNEKQPLYLKIEDSVNAVKSALEEGVVEGSGMAFWRISNDMYETTVGEKILKKALKSPLKQIIDNCNQDYTEIIQKMPKGKGYDAEKGEYVDMLKAGIIDPTKVERCALENAVSFAGVFLTSKGCIALKKPKDE